MDLFRRDDKLLNFLDLNPSLISPKTKEDLDNFKLSKKTFQKVLVEKNFCHSTKMLIDQWRRDTKGSREGIELMTLARHITSNSIQASPEAKGLATTLLTLLEEQPDQERYLQDCEYYDNALKTQRAGIEYHQLLDLQLRTVAFTQVRSKMTSAQLQEMIIDQERYSQFIINSDQSTPDEKEVARKYLKLLNESKVPEEPSVPSNHGSRRGSLGLHHDKRPLPVDSDDDNSITVGASNPKRRITRASGRIG
ncbi:hypothetical protein H0H93_013274 [Arthromyces matolae]|nr:hypothetical protein H0H93_013274 [Arthromyces matolae]